MLLNKANAQDSALVAPADSLIERVDTLPRDPYSPGNSLLTAQFDLLEDFASGWLGPEGEIIQFPWFSHGYGKVVLQRAFYGFPDSIPGDTFYLYVSGMLGRGSVYVKNRLLWVIENPYSEILLPLNREWIAAGTSFRLEINALQPMFSGLIEPMKGVGGDMLLLRRSEAKRDTFFSVPLQMGRVIVPSRMSVISLDDSAPSHPYIRNLYLPFRPSAALQKELKRRNIAFTNLLPAHEEAIFLPPLSDAAGPAFPVPSIPPRGTEQFPAHKITLIFLVVAWLLFLLFYRFTEPDFIRNFFPLILKPFPGAMPKGAISAGRVWRDLLLLFFRVYIGSLSFALAVHFLHSSGMLDKLNLISGRSLIYSLIYNENPSLLLLWLISFSVLLGFELIKIALSRYLALVFSVYDLGEVIQVTENAVAFPLGLILTLPGIVLFFAESRFSLLLWWIWGILAAIYFIRRLAIVYTGLSMAGRMPPGLKFLYICALEILPWLVIL